MIWAATIAGLWLAAVLWAAARGERKMMNDAVIRLFPQPSQAMSLEGLYLADDVRQSAAVTGRPYIYANFVASLDGRIAIPRRDSAGMTVPKQIANPRDWRLFQELAVQADVIISSGRYLRDYAEGRAQEILRVYDDPRFADLRDWRVQHGLAPYPAIAVISASLQFPVPEALTHSGRRVVVYTTSRANADRRRELEQSGLDVVIAGETRVSGDRLVEAMGAAGYRMVYSAAGPQIMHLLLAANVLDRLYLTLVGRLLGGEPFSSIVEGGLLAPAADMRLRAIYFDPAGLEGLGQLFLSYDRAG